MLARMHSKPIEPGKYLRLIEASLPLPPRTEADNQRLIKLLSALDVREDLTAEESAFADLLAIVIEDFEDKHYALPPVPPHEALKALMEDRGLRHKDVWPVIGNKGRTSEVLNGRRKINAALARRLAEHFHVPLELFV